MLYDMGVLFTAVSKTMEREYVGRKFKEALAEPPSFSSFPLSSLFLFLIALIFLPPRLLPFAQGSLPHAQDRGQSSLCPFPSLALFSPGFCPPVQSCAVPSHSCSHCNGRMAGSTEEVHRMHVQGGVRCKEDALVGCVAAAVNLGLSCSAPLVLLAMDEKLTRRNRT